MLRRWGAEAALLGFVEAHKQQLETESKKEKLTYVLANRLKQIGLDGLAECALPTEEALI